MARIVAAGWLFVLLGCSAREGAGATEQPLVKRAEPLVVEAPAVRCIAPRMREISPAGPPPAGALEERPARAALVATDSSFCRLRAGRVACWGGVLGDRLTEVVGLQGVSALRFDDPFICAATRDEDLCWAPGTPRPVTRRPRGDLPEEGFDAEPSHPETARAVARLAARPPEEWPAGEPVVDVARGLGCDCLRGGEGHVMCVGDNCPAHLGALFEGDPPFGGVRDIALDSFGACAVLRSGAVRCGGDRYRLGGEGAILVSLPAGLSPPAQLVTGGRDGVGPCVLHEGGEVSCWDVCGGVWSLDLPGTAVAHARTGAVECAVLRDERVVCRGDGSRGELGNGAPTRVDTWTAIALPAPGSALALTRSATCVGDDEGVRCIGRRFFDGAIDDRPTLVSGLGPRPRALHASEASLCAEGADGRLRCAGQLPAVVRARRAGRSPADLEAYLAEEPWPVWVDATPWELPVLPAMRDVTVGHASVCARSGAEVHCIGANVAYDCHAAPPHCGGGMARTELAYVSDAWAPLELAPVIGLAGDGVYTCALRARGEAVCWGGVLPGSVETTAVAGAPRRVSTPNEAPEIRVRDAHLCGIRAGEVECIRLGPSERDAVEVAASICDAEPTLCGRARGAWDARFDAGGRACLLRGGALSCRGWLGLGLSGGALESWTTRWTPVLEL